jgi:hypothetical protein
MCSLYYIHALCLLQYPSTFAVKFLLQAKEEEEEEEEEDLFIFNILYQS